MKQNCRIGNIAFLLSWLYLLFTLSSCHHDPAIIGELDTVCFSSQVLPVLQASCGGCHNGTSEGLDVTNYETIMQYVVPGNPKRSDLYKVLVKINGENFMPPGHPLDINARSLIEVWIAQGANNTICGTDTTGGGGGTPKSDTVCFQQNVLPIFISNCSMSNCHDGTTSGDDNVFALTNYTSIRSHVVPFNASGSSVYSAVTGRSEEFMPPPPRTALSSTQINTLKKWINDGALNSDCPSATCDTTGSISYTSQVMPVINNFCVSCHNASTTSGGVNLSSYTLVKTYAQSLRNGIPLLDGVIRQLPGFVAMPPSTKLDQCSIREIELWINQGVQNN